MHRDLKPPSVMVTAYGETSVTAGIPRPTGLAAGGVAIVIPWVTAARWLSVRMEGLGQQNGLFPTSPATDDKQCIEGVKADSTELITRDRLLRTSHTRSEQGLRMHRDPGLRLCRHALWAALLAVLVGGCSGSPETSEDKGVQASKVCDGTFDTSAATALKRLSDADRFEELTGDNDAGEPNTFSVDRAVKHLHDELTKRSGCTVYKEGDDSGKPLLDIDFSASVAYPKGSTPSNTGKKRLVYPVGVYSAASENSAQLFFRCTTKAAADDLNGRDADYVEATLFSAGGMVPVNDVSKDLMTVLNSVSKAVAKKVGCAQQAALPRTVPAPIENPRARSVPATAA